MSSSLNDSPSKLEQMALLENDAYLLLSYSAALKLGISVETLPELLGKLFTLKPNPDFRYDMPRRKRDSFSALEKPHRLNSLQYNMADNPSIPVIDLLEVFITPGITTSIKANILCNSSIPQFIKDKFPKGARLSASQITTKEFKKRVDTEQLKAEIRWHIMKMKSQTK